MRGRSAFKGRWTGLCMIAFALSEKMERKERPPNKDERAEMRRNSWKKGPFFEYLPTGLLSLQIESGRHRERH